MFMWHLVVLVFFRIWKVPHMRKNVKIEYLYHMYFISCVTSFLIEFWGIKMFSLFEHMCCQNLPELWLFGWPFSKPMLLICLCLTLLYKIKNIAKMNGIYVWNDIFSANFHRLCIQSIYTFWNVNMPNVTAIYRTSLDFHTYLQIIYVKIFTKLS